MLTVDQVKAQSKALGISMGVTLYQACAIDRLADVLAGIAASYVAELAQGQQFLSLAQADDARAVAAAAERQSDEPILQALMAAVLAKLSAPAL